MAVFRDRREAGKRLADRLTRYKDMKNGLVLALPRGGVVTGAEIADVLHVPLDVFIVRKIGFPGQPELAAGALAETGVKVFNEHIIRVYGIDQEYLDNEVTRQEAEIARRIELYRNGNRLPPLKGKTIILTDDGVATGSTVKAAIETLKREEIARLVLAIPAAPSDTAEELRNMVDEFVCLLMPPDFMAVGMCYDDFRQISDEEVVELLELARQ